MVKIHLALFNLKAFYFIATENLGTIFYFGSKNATYIHHASRTKNRLAWEHPIPQHCFNGNIPLHFFKFTKHIHSIYSVLAAVISALQIITFLRLFVLIISKRCTYEVLYYFRPILEMGRVKHRETEWLAQGHTAHERQNWNPGCQAPESMFPFMILPLELSPNLN